MKSAVDLLLDKKSCLIQKEDNSIKKRNLESLDKLDKEDKGFKETLVSVQNKREKENLKEDKDIIEKKLEKLVKKLAEDKGMSSDEAEKLLIKMLQILRKENLSLDKILKELKIKKEDLLDIFKNHKGVIKLDKLITQLKELMEVNKEVNKMINKDNINLTESDSKKKVVNIKDHLEKEKRNKNVKEEEPKKLIPAQEKNISLEKTKLAKVLSLSEKDQSGLEEFKVVKANYDNRYNKKMLSLEEGRFNESSKNNLNGEFRFNNEISKTFSKNFKNPLVSEAQKQEFMADLIQKIKVYLKRGYSEMRLSLKPESLGSLNLKLAMKDKVLIAKFTVENSAVKEIIENSLNQLKNSFSSLGIDLGEVKVAVGLGEEKQFLEKEEQGVNTVKKVLGKDEEEKRIEEIDETENWQPLWLSRVVDYVA